jgi:uncharacterized protein
MVEIQMLRRRLRLASVTVLALALGACVTPLDGRAPPPRVIAVAGTGRVSVTPDVALLTLGAEARAPALADATADAARRMSAVLERLRALGIDPRDIRTVAYTIEPRTVVPREAPDAPRIVGYHVANVVRVRVRALAETGRVLDAAVTAGANVIRGVALTLDDPAPAEAEARGRAVRDARARAAEIAAAAGVALGEVVTLSEGARPGIPVALEMQRAVLAGPAGPVEPGQLEVVVTVEATYRIGP